MMVARRQYVERVACRIKTIGRNEKWGCMFPDLPRDERYEFNVDHLNLYDVDVLEDTGFRGFDLMVEWDQEALCTTDVEETMLECTP